MNDDKDIAELERMLGGTRAVYQGIRHTAKLRAMPPAPPRRRYGRMALVASVLLAVTVVGFGVVEEMTKPKASPLSFSRPTATLALMRAAQGKQRLTASRPRIAIKMRLPRRPSVSKG